MYPCNAFPSEKSERIYSPELEIRELHCLPAFSGRKRNLGARSPRDILGGPTSRGPASFYHQIS